MLMVICTTTRIFDPLTPMVPHVTTAMPLGDVQHQHAVPPPPPPRKPEVSMTMGITNDGS